MKTIFSILILLSISFNAQADHSETIEFDGYKFFDDRQRINLYIYNKSNIQIHSNSYVFSIEFEDGSTRKYTTISEYCRAYTDCTWRIYLNKQGATKVKTAH